MGKNGTLSDFVKLLSAFAKAFSKISTTFALDFGRVLFYAITASAAPGLERVFFYSLDTVLALVLGGILCFA